MRSNAAPGSTSGALLPAMPFHEMLREYEQGGPSHELSDVPKLSSNELSGVVPAVCCEIR